jgi:hypothetical protein
MLSNKTHRDEDNYPHSRIPTPRSNNIELSKSRMKEYEFIKNVTRKELEAIRNENLKYILSIRGLPQYGCKAELIDRIMNYKNDLSKEDEKLRNLNDPNSLYDKTNEDLEELLLFRALRLGKNKSDKVEILKKYILEIS